MYTDILIRKTIELAVTGKLINFGGESFELAEQTVERIRDERLRLLFSESLRTKNIKVNTVIFKGEDGLLYYERVQGGKLRCIHEKIPFDLPE